MSDVISDSFQSDRAFFGALARYLTPETTPTQYRCRRVRLPDEPGFIAAVSELLSRLCFPEMWLEREDGLTPLEATWLAERMYNDFVESDGYCMIGAIVPIMVDPLPPHMLLCDGTNYSGDDYPDLYARLDDVFKLGDGTFVVPNLMGRFVLGHLPVDEIEGIDFAVGDIGGEYDHELTVDEIAEHTHVQNSHNHTQDQHNHTQNAHGHSQASHNHQVSTTSSGTPGATSILMRAANGTIVTLNLNSVTPAINDATATNQSATATNQAQTATNQTEGDSVPHNNMPPFLTLRYAVIAK